jgi:glycine cleavage system protein P-like pyridoxal-binding family
VSDEIVQVAARAAMAAVERMVTESTKNDGTVDMDALQERLSQTIEQTRAAIGRLTAQDGTGK